MALLISNERRLEESEKGENVTSSAGATYPGRLGYKFIDFERLLSNMSATTTESVSPG